MEPVDARKLLKRYPEIQKITVRILKCKGIDYDNEELNNWEIITIKQPDPATNLGEKNVFKLYIDHGFIINISPLTEDLRKLIDELYPENQSSD